MGLAGAFGFCGQDCGKVVDVGSAFGLGCIRKVGLLGG